MTIQEMKIGDHASVTKTVSETDVYLFAGITGDLNPAHTNEVAASKTMFKTRIAHGCRFYFCSTWHVPAGPGNNLHGSGAEVH